MTETMAATSGQTGLQSLMISTLLLGATIPFFGEERLDPKYFQNNEPEPLKLDKLFEEADEPFWRWLIKLLRNNPNLSEAEIANLINKKLMAGISAKNLTAYETIEHNLTTIKPPSQTVITIPEIHIYGGGDGNDKEQKNTSGDDKSGDKSSQKEETKDSRESGASAASTPTTTGTLQVVNEPVRPQATAAIERYKNDGCTELGGGGYSRVYKTTEDGITLVIKAPCIPPREHYKTEEKYQKEKQRLLNMSRNEKEMLLKLKHESVVKLMAYVEIELPDIGKTFLLVIEYAGQELKHYLKHNYRSIKHYLLQIAQDIVAGLHYLHAEGIVWGDLKSENVVVYRRRHHVSIRLIDPATCQTPEQRKLLMLDHIYTPGWQAPEVYPYVEGMVVTKTADIYALGLIFAMLKGIERERSNDLGDTFKQNRRKEPAKVNSLLISAMSDQVKDAYDLTEEKLTRLEQLDDQTLERLKTDETFLHLMAILATRPQAWRPIIDAIQRYFNVFQNRPNQY